jgi:leader peptidase (prepilin peptidase)/N-methyltransferase
MHPAVVTLVDLPPTLITTVAIVLGLVLGSFLNVVIYRVPRRKSLLWPGSSCPACGKAIAAYDNIPVLSWLLLLGRARCCKARISPRYPLVEAIAGLYAWALVLMVVGDLPGETPWWRLIVIFVLHLCLGLSLVAAAFIDLEHMILPDAITLGGAVIGVATAALRPGIDIRSSLLGAALGFVGIWLPFDVLYRKIRGKVGMGMGDAKLVMLAGAWFGWQGALFALLAGSVQGTFAMIAVLVARGRIDEPDAVVQERKAWLEELERATTAEERERLEREIAADPVLAQAPSEKLGSAKFAFGPFLALSIIEFQLLSATEFYRIWLGDLR